jgi:hypothetical protein
MKSRQAFEGSLGAMVKARLLEAPSSREEALFLIDTFLAASVFLVGVVEKGAKGERVMNCLFTRAHRVVEAMKKVESKPDNGQTSTTGIDGDPIIIQP